MSLCEAVEHDRTIRGNLDIAVDRDIASHTKSIDNISATHEEQHGRWQHSSERLIREEMEIRVAFWLRRRFGL